MKWPYSFSSLLFIILPIAVFGSSNEWNSSKIFHEIKKLKNTNTVLYLAAHPDDENARLITWLANEKKYRTVYLSLTRGDGGQNLIGNEKGALLGTLRTQELLEARKIDGGEQLFTRAVDFGYSKSKEETFEKWEKNKILEDLVFAIRSIQPDLIITRFPPDKRAGHGHHQASAILAEEAFEMAADKSVFPAQLEFVNTWQVQTLMHNSSHWFDKKLIALAQKNSDYVKVDVGGFNPLLGESYNTIAMRARSQHQCQGFGTLLERGSHVEYLKYVKGKKQGKQLFNEIKSTWNAIDQKEEIDDGIDFILNSFDFEHPQKSVPLLIALYNLIDQIPSKRAIVTHKKESVLQIIEACCGLWYESNTDIEGACPGKKVDINISVLARNEVDIKLESIYWNSRDSLVNKELSNLKRTFPISYQIAHNSNHTSPFWLRLPFHNRFEIHDPTLRNLPQNLDKEKIWLQFEIKTTEGIFKFRRASYLNYKWEDKVKGELNKDFTVLPKLSLQAVQKNLYLLNGEKKEMEIIVKAFQENVEGTLFPEEIPDGWTISPKKIPFHLADIGEEVHLSFEVRAPSGSAKEQISFLAKSGEKTFKKELIELSYPHIQTQNVLIDCSVNIAALDLDKNKKRIAYIPGSGDKIPEVLSEIGYAVETIERAEILDSDLSSFESVILGIRVFNLDEQMGLAYEKLMNYVSSGGNLLVQYNTNHSLKTKEIGPFPFSLSKLRVTDENAKVHLNKTHAILKFPNEIDENDFSFWVQERGLYFAESWSEEYETIFSMADKNEEDLSGSTLVCHYGEGSFIYTGISFFRQLEAGVPGALRLFTNFIEYSNNK